MKYELRPWKCEAGMEFTATCILVDGEWCELFAKRPDGMYYQVNFFTLMYEGCLPVKDKLIPMSVEDDMESNCKPLFLELKLESKMNLSDIDIDDIDAPCVTSEDLDCETQQWV